MSQKTTVTVFRTSRADVPAARGSGLPQAPQNLKPSGFCWPHTGHAITIPWSVYGDHIRRRSQAASLDRGDHGLALSRRDPLDPPVGTRRRDRPDVVALGLPVVPAPASSDGDRERAIAGGRAEGPHVVGGHVLPRAAMGLLVQAGAIPSQRPARRARIRVAAADPDRNPRLL